MCATGAGFQPDEPVTLAVDGVAVTAANASAQGGFMWCFTVPGNVVAGANDASAAGADSHGIAVTHFVGVPASAGTFYFVGASTAGGDETLIALLNPQGRTGQVQLQFFLPTGTSFLRTLTVRAHAQTTVALSPYVHGVRGFGLRVQANPLVAAQMIVQRGHANPYTMLGSGLLEKSWYVAEGYTSLSFHETIYVLNPGSSTATVTLRLLPANGQKGRNGSYRVPAGHTYAINVNRLYPHAAVSAHVTSSMPIMVNRVLTFGTGTFGATSGGGAALAATTWLFADGEATNMRQTFLDVLNAGKKRAQVTATLYDTGGRRVGSRVLTVDPLHRGTVRLNDVTHASSFAMYVTSTAPIVAERPIYFGDPNHGRTGGTIASGRNGTGTQWTFPAGDTTHGANEYLLVLNPNRGQLLLHATFYLSSGQVVTRSFTVPGHARLAIDVRHAIQDVSNTLHGAQLTSANKVSFVAEQSIYNEARTTGYSTEGLAQ